MVEAISKSASALAKRADFAIGGANIRPSMRLVEGENSSVVLEPRVMQVLLALYDAQGGVVSRDDLLAQCWPGVFVGDDAINRTIAEIRRVIRETSADFTVETIPRIGYRLDYQDSKQTPAQSKPKSIDRRKLLIGGAGTAVLGGGVAAAIPWLLRRNEVDRLIAQGSALLASGGPEDLKQAEALFRSAIRLEPDRADAWGWLARVVDDEHQERESEARRAANRALELDPREPNARTALIVQQRDIQDWVEWEDSLLEVLIDDPANTMALEYLSIFYQAAGRCKDNWNYGERQYRLEPLNPDSLHRRAFRHWIFGKLPQADKIADQALQLWPRHPYVWNARLLIYAYTDRASAASALLEDIPNRPPNLTQPSLDSWRAALRAIETRSPNDIARAVEVCSANAVLAPGLAANAIMVLSYLGELDSAYMLADGLFAGRGEMVQQKRGAGIKDVYSGAAWGRTQFLFIPPTTAFRNDTRFQQLCELTGHVSYWSRRGIWPDPFVRGSLQVT